MGKILQFNIRKVFLMFCRSVYIVFAAATEPQKHNTGSNALEKLVMSVHIDAKGNHDCTGLHCSSTTVDTRDCSRNGCLAATEATTRQTCDIPQQEFGTRVSQIHGSVAISTQVHRLGGSYGCV